MDTRRHNAPGAPSSSASGAASKRGALLFVDLNLKGDRAARFLAPGALWQQWLQGASHMQDTTDPASYLSLIRRLCIFVEECADAR
ncbi:DUF6000 family protein [Streptomyces siamensis]|uniref:DUF6000 family protein n=1 Tax=Streptomyces siamensis TaxID=1274986 RepID=UPI0031EB7D50